MYCTKDIYIFVILWVRHSQYRAFGYKYKDEFRKELTCDITIQLTIVNFWRFLLVIFYVHVNVHVIYTDIVSEIIL